MPIRFDSVQEPIQLHYKKFFLFPSTSELQLKDSVQNILHLREGLAEETVDKYE